jgi:EAL domain-containing protein (putative c-di-GMP-specific phosphodiesterase class I)/ActR/RegA family two-component response regulator
MTTDTGAAPLTAAPRVLIAEDDEPLARFFARALEAAGYDVQLARDGADAKRTLSSQKFDAIVSDISMPGMSGIELLEAIRRHDLDVPVILVTGEPELATAVRAVEHGALRYLEKPVSPELLREVVAGAARLHDLARVKREALSLLQDRAREASDRAGLESAFDDVLDSLAVAFQPIAEIAPRRILAYEALLRSSHPSLPDPGSVLDAAQRLGRMHELGRAVRGRVAEAAPRLSRDVLLFVNVHPAELLDEDFFSLDSSLSAHARRVVLEVTERATLDSVPDLSRRIARLRALGYRLAVDDLGAGYAGLTAFVRLNPEYAKIDMTLVRELHLSEPKQALVRSILELCRGMGIRVVAEGVETMSELRALVRLEADLIQGYLLGRPGREFSPLPALALEE